MEKIYFSIAEVAEESGLSQSNIRFWEKEFDKLKPKRNNKGTRFYTKEDIEILKQIKHLVNDQKLTLEGAKKRLNQKKDAVAKQQKLSERLKFIRQELKGISTELSK